MSDRQDAVIVRDMGYTAREFSRVLAPAMRDWSVNGGPDAWKISDRDGVSIARIGISPLPERTMGSLRLPVLAVTMDLGGTPPELVAEFMRRFDRGFHRGGG